MVTASGKRDAVIGTPDFRGVVNKFPAIIAMKLNDGEQGGGFDMGESWNIHLWALLRRESMGLVRLFPFNLMFSLSFLRCRSMDAGLIFVSFSAMISEIPKAGYWAMYALDVFSHFIIYFSYPIKWGLLYAGNTK